MPWRRPARVGRVARGGREDGSAVVEFALVGTLVVLIFLAILQLGMVMHVRNTAVACAAEGARYGAEADRTPSDGATLTGQLFDAALARGLRGDPSARVVTTDGAATVEVTMTVHLPLIGLLGPAGDLTVHGHAFVEGQ